ncbi:MAG TPA: kelch repeat-containing protein [Acidimicrobiales bacterium]|nr:kelch repeat-containing protein [Acidimicrobiales bacterium]
MLAASGSVLPAPLRAAAGGAVPSTGTWVRLADLPTNWGFPTLTRLPDGRVLAAGGRDSSGRVTTNAELYDPSTRTWRATRPMHVARDGASATELGVGVVLVAGGTGANGGTRELTSAEIYNPTTGSWYVTGSMNVGRGAFSLVTLATGDVLAAGGWPDTRTSYALTSAELYNPVSRTWSFTGSMAKGRAGYMATLSNGDVLFPGGITCCGYSSIQTAERYSLTTGRWTSAGSMGVPRAQMKPITLSDGRVLVAGGDLYGIFDTTATADIYDPSTNTWSMTQPMSDARLTYAVQGLSDGQVLVATGLNDSAGSLVPSAELYQSLTGSWTASTSVPVPAYLPSSVALADGGVLLVGGHGPTGVPLDVVQLFTPPQLPTISVTPRSKHAGASVKVTGGGYGPGAVIDIYFDRRRIALAIATDTGTLRVRVVIPPRATAGPHVMSAVERDDGIAGQDILIVKS